MPGKGDSSFPCLFSVAMAKEPKKKKRKRNEHVGSGWRTERIMGEGHEAAPGGRLDVPGAGISDNGQLSYL